MFAILFVFRCLLYNFSCYVLTMFFVLFFIFFRHLSPFQSINIPRVLFLHNIIHSFFISFARTFRFSRFPLSFAFISLVHDLSFQISFLHGFVTKNVSQSLHLFGFSVLSVSCCSPFPPLSADKSAPLHAFLFPLLASLFLYPSPCFSALSIIPFPMSPFDNYLVVAPFFLSTTTFLVASFILRVCDILFLYYHPFSSIFSFFIQLPTCTMVRLRIRMHFESILKKWNIDRKLHILYIFVHTFAYIFYLYVSFVLFAFSNFSQARENFAV